MKEKSDIAKLLEGRCRGSGKDYTGFKKANEAHSTGTAVQICDPIADRTVDVLSMGEEYVFWIFRYDENVEEIREQQVMLPEYVTEAALHYGFRVPKRILTVDFLIIYKDGTKKAISVKCNRAALNPETRSGRMNIRRQMIEKYHWNKFSVPHEIIFSDEVNRFRAINIRSCMKCYNRKWVDSVEKKYRYLIAHHVVEPDLDSGLIPFAKIAREHEDEINRLYERVIADEEI